LYGIEREKTVFELIRQARRRIFFNELLSQGANAFCAVLCAIILLLLLGAQVLNWYWLLPIPAAAAAAGIFFAKKRTPSSYATAQMVDWRMSLADALSTALYFSEAKSRSASPEMRRSQMEQAESLARSVDLRRAIPYSVPRSAYVMAALTLVASSLFALRYGLTKRLDLKPPLVSILQDKFSPGKHDDLAMNTRRKPPAQDPQDDSRSNLADPNEAGNGQQDPAPNAAETGNQPGTDQKGQSKNDGGKQQGGEQRKDGEAQAEQPEDGSQQESGKDGSASQSANSDPNGKQSDGKQSANNGSESGSLMSKVKDTLQNLLSRMKPQQQNSAAPPQQAANQNAKQGGGQQTGEKQQQSSKDGQQSGSQQADAQQGESAENQQSSQNSQGKGSGKSDAQQAAKQPGSGVGSENGNKEIRQAEQLAAMGKISELIGKRSANVTGESTIEVQSTSQQLHTAYVQRGTQHGQGDAEISRDEIPVALQPYVEQYFDQLRKVTPAQPAVKK
jgi:hypothetical protein